MPTKRACAYVRAPPSSHNTLTTTTHASPPCVSCGPRSHPTSAATFGSPVPKQAAPGPEGPATSSFLPNLGGDERTKRRNMDDDDEALMEDILSNL